MNVNLNHRLTFGSGQICAENSLKKENRSLTNKEQLEFIEKAINNTTGRKIGLNKGNKLRQTIDCTDNISLKNGDSLTIARHSTRGKPYCMILHTTKDLAGESVKASVVISNEGHKNPKLARIFSKLIKTFIK